MQAFKPEKGYVVAVPTTVKSEIEKAQNLKRKEGMEKARKKAAEQNAAKKAKQSVSLTAGVLTTVEKD